MRWPRWSRFERVAWLLSIGFVFSTSPAVADTYETSWTVPRWHVEAGLGVTPWWVYYDASGLFYSGFPTRTVADPNLMVALGLGAGVQVGGRWGALRGCELTFKYNMRGQPGNGTALHAAINPKPPPVDDSAGWHFGVRLGLIQSWEGPGVPFPVSLGTAVGFSHPHGPLVNDSVELGGSSEQASAPSYLMFEFGFPIRFGDNHSFRLMPVLSEETFFRRVRLGHEHTFGVETPITARSIWTIGVSLAYSQNR